MEAESAAKERTEPSGKLAFSNCGLFCREAGRRAFPRRKSRGRGAERTAQHFPEAGKAESADAGRTTPHFPETEKPRARSRTDRSAFFP